MTASPAHEPPFALDGQVNAAKLEGLLEVGTELTWLDLKRECDLSNPQARIEFAKDVGAMQLEGGYLIVGVEDDGMVVGLPIGQANHFDEARVRDKLDRYMGDGYDLRSQVHKVKTDTGEVDVALVWVAPHPDGYNVFKAPGNYPTKYGKQQAVFRAGDVFVRHGSKSERWNQGDLAAGNARRDAAAKELWRGEASEEFARMLRAAVTASNVVTDPSVSFTWKLDTGGFEAATVELIRRDDDVPMRRMLRGAQDDVRRLVSDPVGRVRDIFGPSATGRGPAALDELVTVLDRLTSVAALALELDRPDYFTLVTRSLAELYGWSVTDPRVKTSEHGLAPLLWLRLAERLYALGGLAVRLARWAQARQLVLLDIAGLDEFGDGRTWHRDALTQANRSDLLKVTREDGRIYEASLLHLATGVAAQLPALHPDLPDLDPRSPRDPVLLSICEFDLLASIVASINADADDVQDVFYVSYPSYARFSGGYDKVVVQLVGDPMVRTELVGSVGDATLARVLTLVDQAARTAGQRAFGWDGYRNQVVKSFIEKHAS